jgi:histidyl-tRNA synthetase
MSKPSLPQGTRDFSAETVHKRNYILSTIKHVFELYGFQPLETPAMENLDTLMGKYGEEGDRLIFKILNNGLNDPKNIDKAKAGFEKVLEGKNSSLLTERALKYDLTIPFARYVAMNHGILTFPFKRYQIQPVWRADRPQKGRYREFTQCDADIVGSNALLNELDLTNIYHNVFISLGIKEYTLKINNRKILLALAQSCGGEHLLTDITIAIDKLDKIGLDKVKAELEQRGLNETQIKSIETYLGIKGKNEEKLKAIIDLLGSNEMAKKGFEELEWITQHSTQANIEIDFTLARGLNYYTGSIFEVKAPENVQMGSIGGGGRYDNLTELFGVPGIPGVGISFGVDRIFDVMEELNLFPADAQFGTQVMFFNLGESESLHAYSIMQGIRKNGISAELYHESVKLDKQFKYADKKKISYVVILGSKEIEEKICLVKHLKTGIQESVAIDGLSDYLKTKISAE